MQSQATAIWTIFRAVELFTVNVCLEDKIWMTFWKTDLLVKEELCFSADHFSEILRWKVESFI